MKVNEDRQRTDMNFQVGDKVLLTIQPYAQSSLINRPYPMLAKKYYGPYTVLQKIGNDAYRLDLPPSSLIHPTFHVSQLKAFTPDHTSVFLNYLQWSAWTGLMSCLKLYWIVVSLKKATMLSRRYSSSGPSSLLHWQPGNRGVPPKPETQCKILRWALVVLAAAASRLLSAVAV